MKVLLANLPWECPGKPLLWGVRAGSRWPHFQRRPQPGELPRYIPFPFFLSIAATNLAEHGFDVVLIDAVAENIAPAKFKERVALEAPDLIFAETSTPSLEWDLNLLRELKTSQPNLTVICGGAHAADEAIARMHENGFPDFWLAGEYDQLLVDVIQALADGQVPTGTGISSVNSRNIELAGVDVLDELPTPLFAQLPMASYSDPVCGLPAPGAQTWLSRGCPFSCSFCVWPQVVYGRRQYRVRSIDKALDEVEYMIEQFGCESFYFDDDTTNIGEKRMLELADSIRRRGLDCYPWAMMARADCMSDRMLEALADAGMYAVKYGVESVSRKLLNACDKGTDLNKLFRALDKTRDLGIKMHLTFTFGLPGETLATIDETMDFAVAFAPESAQFSVCTPFPGTSFFQECVNNGWLTTTDLNRFLGSGEETVVSTPELSADELSQAYQQALGRWQQFQANRLDRRRQRLKAELDAELTKGRSWTFVGESEWAQFLGDAFDCVKSFEQADFAVIVSRHDEEKLYRHLLRDGRFHDHEILRLYHD